MALNFPTRFVAGDTVIVVSTALRGNDPVSGQPTDFSPSTHTLSFAIRGATALDLVASDNNGAYTTTITGQQSLSLTPGSNYWQAFITRNNLKITIAQGQLEVIRSLAASASPFDGRSTSEIILEKLEAYLKGDPSVASYKIGERELKRHSMVEILQLRSKLKLEIARGQGKGFRLLARF